MHSEMLEDPIDVDVRFSQRGMRPLWFIWQGRRRVVREVTCAWHERDGALVHRCFSVSDGESLYELRFDARALRWHLMKVAL
jgi:hypothetical protein